ncbi:hypothetical protein E4U54_006422 [Claviceps lovelessii]|nr:hypothetical protein E4U54_006422 [Claviceps lovelessii]
MRPNFEALTAILFWSARRTLPAASKGWSDFDEPPTQPLRTIINVRDKASLESTSKCLKSVPTRESVFPLRQLEKPISLDHRAWRYAIR